MISEQERVRRINAFAEMERAHSLFAFRFDGWSAWRVMRNALHGRVSDLPFAAPTHSSFVRVWEAMLATFGFCWLVIFGRRRDLVVQTCRSALRVREGSKFLDVNFDGLLKRGHSHLKLVEINSRDFERQAANALFPSHLDPVVFSFWGRVLGSFFPVRAMNFCLTVSELMQRELKVSVDPRWLLMRISTVYWQEKLYGFLLARIRPKAVLVADTGAYALCLASFRRGIRFVELQHGIFDNDHPDAVPLWVDGSRGELLLPDWLAVRGEYWVRQLEQTRQGRECAITVGNEQIDIARQRRLQRQPNDRLELVLTSQGCDTVQLVSWIEQMIATAPLGQDWRLSIKLHPFYDTNPQAFAGLSDNARVEIVNGGAEPNVFTLLEGADLHLSITSACHFDAVAIGVPTVVIPLAGHEALLPIVDEQQMSLARQPANVWSIARNGFVDPGCAQELSFPGFVANLESLILRAVSDPRMVAETAATSRAAATGAGEAHD